LPPNVVVAICSKVCDQSNTVTIRERKQQRFARSFTR
jgi:hypothetical protein